MIVQISLNLNKGTNTITRKRLLKEGKVDYGFRRLPDIALETINRSIDDDAIWFKYTSNGSTGFKGFRHASFMEAS